MKIVFLLHNININVSLVLFDLNSINDEEKKTKQQQKTQKHSTLQIKKLDVKLHVNPRGEK